MDKVKEWATGIAVVLFWVALLGGAVLFSSTESEPVCETIAIPFESVEEETDNLPVGETETHQYGEEGEREVCTKGDKTVSDEVLTEPTDEIIWVGIAGFCEDVTSYDYNWNNDMLCTRPDGSQFYTNYAGAENYESNF